MDILKPIKDKFILFCVCPSNLQNPLIKYRNRAFSMFCSIVLMTFFFTSAAYILKHFKDDLEGCLLAMLSGSASLGLISMMMAAHLLQNQVTDIFSDFTVTCDKYKHLDSGEFVQIANDRSVRFTKYGNYFIVICCVTCFILMATSLIISFLKFGYANLEILYLPFKLVLPWDQNCFSGWVGEGALSIIIIFVSVLVASTFLVLFVSFLFFNSAFYHIYRDQFDKINAISSTSTPKNEYEAKHLLLESILFHISAKELFEKSARVYGSFILISLINTVISMATAVCQLDLALRHLDLAFFMMFESFLYSIGHLYAYCHVGKYSTDSFLAFADCLFESNWMSLPTELARSFPMMIAHAQRPLYYHGSNTVILDLELFIRMMKTVCSYYLMFKTLTDA